MSTSTKETKIVYLEILRIIAVFCIIFNHSGARGDSLYAYTDSKISFTISLLMAIICRIGVPLFWMISGALLIIKEEDMHTVYTKRIPRMLLVLVSFTTIRYLYVVFIVQSETFNILNMLKYLFNGKLFLPYWFLYTYIALLFILPILSKGLIRLSFTDYKYLIFIEVLLRIILPTISALGITDFGIQFIFCETIEFVIWGYYFEYVMLIKNYNSKGILCAIAVIILSIGGMFIFSILKGDVCGLETKIYSELYKLPLSVACFYLVKAINLIKPIRSEKLVNIVLYLGSMVFGIYLIEDYLRNATTSLCDYLSYYIHSIPACTVWLIGVFILGVLFITIIKRIPFIRHFI